MVRINLISPESLADQHLNAEYNEILMLVGHLKKHGVDFDKIPKYYCLGKGHINFFKNKLGYLRDRYEHIKKEMRKRGFNPEKTLEIRGFGRELRRDFKPRKVDFELIKKRLAEKIRLKPNYYRYYGEYKGRDFFIRLLK